MVLLAAGCECESVLVEPSVRRAGKHRLWYSVSPPGMSTGEEL